LFTVQAGGGCNAGVDCPVSQHTVHNLTQHHSTGTTIPGGTAFFGPLVLQFFPEVIEHGDMGTTSTQAVFIIVKQKSNHKTYPQKPLDITPATEKPGTLSA
jgi:hypothetical protein